MKECLYYQEVDNEIGAATCPSEDTHRFEDNLHVGSLCKCVTWCIVRIIDPSTILCMNLHGETEEFKKA